MLAVVLLAGCGGTGSSNSSSAKRASALEAANKREQTRNESERPAHEKQAAGAEAILKRIGPCDDVYRAEQAMTKTVVSAIKPGASEAAYEEASGDIDALRGKLTELTSVVSHEQRTQIEDSRRFLLKVGTLVEAFKTQDLSLAQEELSGYRAGMVELDEHIKAACT